MIKNRFVNISPLLILAEGLVSANGIGEGRFIPVVIIDVSVHPKISELFRVHEHAPSGDVLTQWGTVLFKSQFLFLKMQFKSPMEAEFEILFDVVKNTALIDSIMHAQALYIQAGQPGDSVSGTFNKEVPRILAEIPRTFSFEKWDKLAHKVTMKKLRNKGLNRDASRKAATEVLRSGREMWKIRRP